MTGVLRSYEKEDRYVDERREYNRHQNKVYHAPLDEKTAVVDIHGLLNHLVVRYVGKEATTDRTPTNQTTPRSTVNDEPVCFICRDGEEIPVDIKHDG